MKVKMNINISGESLRLPTLYLTEKGVQIGEEHEEGGYDSHTRYIAPEIAWEDLAEFSAMIQEAHRYKEKLEAPVIKAKK